METTSHTSNNNSKIRRYQIQIWVITFLIYAVYHLTRKVFSIIKAPLNPKDDPLAPIFPPFTPDDAKSLLGSLDTIFLASYAISLFFSGHIADRSNLRIFIPLGLIGCAASLMMWPAAYAFNIHYFWFFALSNVLSGIFQSSGWPAVVAAMSRWFPKGRRGMIMGIWNSHTSIGNILGSIVCTAALKLGMGGYGWPYAFVLPSIIAVICAGITAIFIIGDPAEVGCSIEEIDEDKTEEDILITTESVDSNTYGTIDLSSPNTLNDDASAVIYGGNNDYDGHEDHIQIPSKGKGVGFFEALTIPGVIEFSLSLFFCKLVAYTFLFWLPSYLKSLGYDNDKAGYLSTFFDIGGILGGIIVGYLSDTLRKPGMVSVFAMVVAAPLLIIYRHTTSEGIGGVPLNAFLMFIMGMFVNGPYSLITTAVSADLGSHPMLGNDASALATVSGIIDGTGTIGSAAQGILISLVSNSKEGEDDWDAVFYLLASCAIISALLLIRVFLKEYKSLQGEGEGEGYMEAAQTESQNQTINHDSQTVVY